MAGGDIMSTNHCDSYIVNDGGILEDVVHISDEEAAQKVLRSLQVTSSMAEEIEFLTRNQRNNPLWYQVRSKRVTGLLTAGPRNS